MPTCIGSLCVFAVAGAVLVGFMIVLGTKAEGDK